MSREEIERRIKALEEELAQARAGLAALGPAQG
jgi:ribosomal protein L29